MAVPSRRIAPALLVGATLAVATLVLAGEKPASRTPRSLDATTYSAKGEMAAQRFGRRRVQVEVLERGDGRRQP